MRSKFDTAMEVINTILLEELNEIQQNIIGIRQVFDKYIKFGESSSDAIQPNNAEWLENLNYVEFHLKLGVACFDLCLKGRQFLSYPHPLGQLVYVQFFVAILAS